MSTARTRDGHKPHRGGLAPGLGRWAAVATRIGGLALGLALCSMAQAQRTATAVATLSNGAVDAVTVTDPGEGYLYPPSVSITGGGGVGATATATISDGSVRSITVTAPGGGYTNVPEVVVGPPDVLVFSFLEMDLLPRITIYGDIGATNQVQWANALGDTNIWTVLTNIVLPSSPFVFYDTLSPKGSQRYYRAVVGGGGARPVAMAGFVWIPAGRFTMGSPANEQDRHADEGPQMIVTLTRGFFMGSREVTQGEYQVVVGGNPSFFTGDLNLPVEQVSWIDATDYSGRLTEQERTAGRLPLGWVYRLPTEAEWEYAARAGTTTRFSFGDDLGYGLLGQYAWYGDNSGNTIHAVAGKRPNRWGLYDMNGNVWEWCSDWHGNYPGGTVKDPHGAATGEERIIRGCSWDNGAANCRSAGRNSVGPDSRINDVGFRAVLAPVQ